MPPIWIPPLYRSAAWSLLGTVVPIAAALAAVPFLFDALGQERLGVLSLIWVVVGYFSFLDMGLGRAVTVAVASCERASASRAADEIEIVSTASLFLVIVGNVVARRHRDREPAQCPALQRRASAAVSGGAGNPRTRVCWTARISGSSSAKLRQFC